MTQSTGNSMSQVEMQQCIQDCLRCHAVCVQTAADSLKPNNQRPQTAHMHTLLDCAEICLTSAHFMMRDDALHGNVCKVCAQICTHCADECDLIGETDCANACKTCAFSCEQMAKIVA